MAETVRDFLVSLGYRVDGGSEAKFTRSIETATKAVVGLGVTLAAVTTAVTGAVTKIAAGFDELYYASQRTKASAENIKAVGFAVSQLGGSYQGAVSSLESFAQKLRSNPGYEAMARNIGVATRENGRLRDTTKLMEDIAKAAAKMPTHVAIQYLDAFGIDEATAKAMASGEFAKRQDELRAKYKAIGADQEKAAQTGMNLSNAWRSLGATAEAFGAKLMISLGPGIGEMVKRFDDFLVRNADRIVNFFERARQFVEKLLAAFVQLVEKGEGPIVEFFDTMTKGVGEMAKAFDKFAMFLAGGFLVTVLAAFASVNKGFTGMLMKLGIPAALIATVFGHGPLAEHFREQGRQHGAKDPDVAQVAGTAKAAQGAWETVKRAWRTRPQILGGTGGDPANGAAVAPTGSQGRRAAAQDAYAFWRSKGLTHEQASGVVANEQAESAHNPRARGDGGLAHGLYQHHPDRRAAILAGTGIDMSTADAQQQREATFWELSKGQERKAWEALKRAESAGEAASVFSTLFERPRDKAGEAQKRAAIANGLASVLRLKDQETKDQQPPVGAGPRAGVYSQSSSAELEAFIANPRVPDNLRALMKQELDARRNAPASGGFNPSRFDMVKDGRGIPAFDPNRLARIQANAALGAGTFGLGGIQALTPPPASNTNVDMQQRTEITILGGSDPQATAREVAGAQERINGGMLRNVAGAVR